MVHCVELPGESRLSAEASAGHFPLFRVDRAVLARLLLREPGGSWKIPVQRGRPPDVGGARDGFLGIVWTQGIYEETVGRFTEWVSGHQPVEEDLYAYRVARAYADSVHIRPFYEFHFGRSFTGLWKDTHLWGPHPLRKWERKLWLSLDYGVEALYCGLIDKASHGVYGVEDDQTYAWIENAPDAVFPSNPRIRKVKDTGAQASIVVIPRYQEFTDIVSHMARQGVRFVQIAGNEQVLVT